MQRPLADEIRPKTLDEVVGQRHLLAPGAVLRRLIESGTDTEITSTSIKVEAQKDALDAEMRSYYEALKTAQQAG